jgi:hypothetical protein
MNAASVAFLWLLAIVVPAGMLYNDARPELRARAVAKDGAIVLVRSDRIGTSRGTHGSVYRWRIFEYTYGDKAYRVSERDPTPVEADADTAAAPFEQHVRRVDPQDPGYVVVEPTFSRDWWIGHLMRCIPLGLFISVYAFMATRALRKGRKEPA